MHLVDRHEWPLGKPVRSGQQGAELTENIADRCCGFDRNLHRVNTGEICVSREQENPNRHMVKDNGDRRVDASGRVRRPAPLNTLALDDPD